MKILALIFDGFEEEEAMAPFALTRRAGIELDVASYSNTVIGSHNFALTNILLLKDINYKNYDMLLIPGGRHYVSMYKDAYVHEIIRYYFDNNKYVAGICAAPTIFGLLGYLKGKNYTCFTSMNQDFKGNYTDLGVCQDGKLITAKSVAYSIEFAYKIIEVLMGKEVLNKVQKQIYYEK